MIVIYYIMQNSFEWQNWMIVNLMVGTVQLVSHLDMLYTVEFSFKSNSSQWRSICVFEAYIQLSLI